MTGNDCLICDRITLIENDENPYFVKELETGYVVLGDHQYFTGYSLLLCKEHVFELHELQEDYRTTFLSDMARLAQGVYRAFGPAKLNYELLGNGDPHLHWHIFPRYVDDGIKGPVWNLDSVQRQSLIPTREELKLMRGKLLEHL